MRPWISRQKNKKSRKFQGLAANIEFAKFTNFQKINRTNSTFKGRNKKSRDLAVLPRRDEARNDLQKILRAEF